MNNFAKIEEIYHSALELSAHERKAFLRDSCNDDEELRREVESLLSLEAQAANFIETPPEDIATLVFTKHSHHNLLGEKLNHYQIVSELGKGGMGEVFLAEDTKLGRKVAIKILPAQFAADEERKNRFEKEARAISLLNHPNIITIYGIEQSEDFNFIVTELVEGKTLRELIAEKPFSPKETVEIGIQIADALDSAHLVGIIHRDIKPANVMIRRDGIVKVLDFGLAKLVESGELGSKEILSLHSRLSTPDSRLTKAEAVMGTINYMSPEQALGETVDFRTDIFSFGVVLYEMLSGVKPFDGVSDAAIYNATINQNPLALTELNAEIPLVLDKIIFHAIEKKRDERYQTIAELKRDLLELKENTNSDLLAKKFAVKRKYNFVKFAIPIFAIILLAAITYFLYFNRTSNQTVESKGFAYTQLTTQSGEELFPNFSPDGKAFLYSSRESGNWDIYLKQIDGTNQINLTKDSIFDEKQAVFSPNGEQIAFRSERNGGGIFVMNSNGENVRQITDMGFYPNWSPDGKEIVYCIDDFSEPGDRTITPSKLWSVNVETLEKRLISATDAVQPNWSPNGWRIAFWNINSGGQRDVWTISAKGDEPIRVTDDTPIDWNPIWSADGKYLYFVSDRSGSMNLWRTAIDEKTGKVLSQPEAVTIPSKYSQFFDFSRDGKNLIYVQSTNYSNIFQIDFDAKKETVGKKIVEITHGSKLATNPQISADNKLLTFDAIGDKQEDIFVAKPDGSEIRQLTNDVYKDRVPNWSPDGTRIAFFSDRTGKYEGWTINADGTNLKEIAKSPENAWTQFAVWSPDGKRILYDMSGVYPMIFDSEKAWNEQTPQSLPKRDDFNNRMMMFSWSPDGKKLAGYVVELETSNSYIITYDLTTQKYETLTDFGKRPFWLADNRRLIFCSRDKIYLLDSKTKAKKEIFSVAPYRLQSISLSKDNRAIYYTVQKSESDIWLANTQ